MNNPKAPSAGKTAGRNSTSGTTLSLIRWFSDITVDDLPTVGGKNSSLGEMYRNLCGNGIKVPNGYAITADAYFYLLRKAGIEGTIQHILSDLDTSDIMNLQEKGACVRQLILEARFPKRLRDAIVENYRKLEKEYGSNVDVAVRSSGTAEDLADASFAGQQDTFLNIRGTRQLLRACRQCFASVFTNRAISYREDKKFDHLSVGLSITVQKMVRSDRGASGVMFSIDTESGHRDVVLINAAYGLGENVVQGAVNPDEFYIHKPTLKKGFPSIVSKSLGTKRLKTVYAGRKGRTKNAWVPYRDRGLYCITDEEVLQLAKMAVKIEDHYSKLAKKPRPMDIEWAKDGFTDEIYIVQARPETVMSNRDANILVEYRLTKEATPIVKGSAVGSRVGLGRAAIIRDSKYIHEFRKGDVLVTYMTDPDWEPIMKIASAIVTDEGGRTSHAAIVSRELGIPAIVGAAGATKEIPLDQFITVSCCEGDTGMVYPGKIPFKIKKTKLDNITRPKKTEIKMILGTPEKALGYSQIPNDGVGLARQEFIINSAIKIHPMALVKYSTIQDKHTKRAIDKLTIGYSDKKDFYVDKLTSGIATIAAAFYPREVIVRLSDFRSNEYADLIGGRKFEPEERNPMIGWRGASRYYDDTYRPAFDLECAALKKVRDVMGLTNVKVMVPFCRTVEEGKKVIKVMAENGLKQHANGLEVYVMCEVPSNVILADQFAEVFDGFSIGSNDLTQLTLGLDRDSGLIAHVGDENNEAIKRMISQVIKTAKEKGRKVGICGQGPSDFPDFAKFLVNEGIDSISLNPDTILETTVRLSKLEGK
jgi:pyruvate,water dikinase